MSKTPNKPTKKIFYKKSHMSEVKPQITKKFIEIDKRENLKESRKTPKVIRSIKPSLKEKYNKAREIILLFYIFHKFIILYLTYHFYNFL